MFTSFLKTFTSPRKSAHNERNNHRDNMITSCLLNLVVIHMYVRDIIADVSTRAIARRDFITRNCIINSRALCRCAIMTPILKRIEKKCMRSWSGFILAGERRTRIREREPPRVQRVQRETSKPLRSPLTILEVDPRS